VPFVEDDHQPRVGNAVALQPYTYPGSAVLQVKAMWGRLFQVTSSVPEAQRLVQAASAQMSPATMVHEARRLSGLTYEALGRIFGVDRRAVHYWVSGEAISDRNLGLLEKLLTTLRRIDRGTQTENKALLNSRLAHGKTGVELLACGAFDVVEDAAGPGAGTRIKLGRIDRARTPTSGLHPDGWLETIARSAVDEGAQAGEVLTEGEIVQSIPMPKE
jgi:hypothetical protein